MALTGFRTIQHNSDKNAIVGMTCYGIVTLMPYFRAKDNSDISQLRHPYHGPEACFDVNHLASKHPYRQFTSWFEEARKVPEILEPNAMAVATASRDGIPSLRTVLMKNYSTEGITFYTNYDSRKGKELTENPRCALMFYWEPQKRVVRIEGAVERISKEASTQYFNSRPRDSQLGALVSHQSTVVRNRDVFNSQYESVCAKYSEKDAPIPKPSYWGGYLVRPNSYEFWQGQSNRLHDRLRFRKMAEDEKFDPELMERGEDDWIIERLSP